MRKPVSLVFLAVAMLFLFACDMDPYAGRRPVDREDSYWICEEDDIWFYVGEEWPGQGVIAREEGDVEFSLLWSSLDHSVIFVTDYYRTDGILHYTALMDGACKFYLKRCVIAVKEDYVGLYPEGELPVLTFTMQKEPPG